MCAIWNFKFYFSVPVLGNRAISLVQHVIFVVFCLIFFPHLNPLKVRTWHCASYSSCSSYTYVPPKVRKSWKGMHIADEDGMCWRGRQQVAAINTPQTSNDRSSLLTRHEHDSDKTCGSHWKSAAALFVLNSSLGSQEPPHSLLKLIDCLNEEEDSFSSPRSGQLIRRIRSASECLWSFVSWALNRIVICIRLAHSLLGNHTDRALTH